MNPASDLSRESIQNDYFTGSKAKRFEYKSPSTRHCLYFLAIHLLSYAYTRCSRNGEVGLAGSRRSVLITFAHFPSTSTTCKTSCSASLRWSLLCPWPMHSRCQALQKGLPKVRPSMTLLVEWVLTYSLSLGTTGGAGGQTVKPSSTAELVSYLGSSEPLTIVLDTTFDFTGTEGTTTGAGCAPWGTASGCQTAIDQNDWCQNYESSAPAVTVTYDNAAITPITVASDKTLLGVGSSGVIKGKGLKIAGGVSNIVIQNIAITDLNPQYVWGGDAITLDGSSKVWIDHVKASGVRSTETWEQNH